MSLSYNEKKYQKLEDSQLEYVAGGTATTITCANCGGNSVTVAPEDGKSVYTCADCGKRYYIDLRRGPVYLN